MFYVNNQTSDNKNEGGHTSQRIIEKYPVILFSPCGNFLNYCEKPAQELDKKDVRRFLDHLINGRKHTPATINNYSAAIRFFFAVTINRTMNYLQIPRMKTAKTLPEVITKAEASELINNCRNIKHGALLLLAYGSGLRVNEIACLHVRDIDSNHLKNYPLHHKEKTA